MTRRSVPLDWSDRDSLERLMRRPDRASPAAVKAMATALLAHSHTDAPSHKLKPGLHVHARRAEITDWRMLSNFVTEATAVHSRSAGWLPHVLVAITHDRPNADAAGSKSETLHLLIPAELAEHLMEQVHDVAQRAFLDAMTGPVEGLS